MTQLKFWVALSKIGFGYATLQPLLKKLGTVEEVWRADEKALSGIGASPTLIQRFLQARSGIDFEQDIEPLLRRNDYRLLDIDHRLYPDRLRQIHSPPLVLYVRGDEDVLHHRCLTVVGTRKPTFYGLRATAVIAEPLAHVGVIIVSGLAYGIDAAAHRAALRASGRTIAVLGSGIDQIYPAAHRSLAAEILQHGGAIISEYPPDTETQRHFFPMRNRILSGLSSTVVIVEAGMQSGALITARFALEENRDVFAVPGPIDAETSSGTNNLLRLGAAVVTRADDLRESLGLDSPTILADNAEIAADSETEAILLRLLNDSKHVDELTTISTLDVSVVNATLSLLEMKGRVRHLGGMYYIRI